MEVKLVLKRPFCNIWEASVGNGKNKNLTPTSAYEFFQWLPILLVYPSIRYELRSDFFRKHSFKKLLEKL